MFYTGVVIGLLVGTCLGFVLSSFFFTKIGLSTERKWLDTDHAGPLGRDVRLEDQFLWKCLSNELIRLDKTLN